MKHCWQVVTIPALSHRWLWLIRTHIRLSRTRWLFPELFSRIRIPVGEGLAVLHDLGGKISISCSHFLFQPPLYHVLESIPFIVLRHASRVLRPCWKFRPPSNNLRMHSLNSKFSYVQ
jgi:hypothetical protein